MEMVCRIMFYVPMVLWVSGYGYVEFGGCYPLVTALLHAACGVGCGWRKWRMEVLLGAVFAMGYGVVREGTA